jgi:hypothetical protein
LVFVKSLSYKPFVYLRLLITPLISVKSFSYKPFVYLLLLITSLVSVKSLDKNFTDTNGVMRSRKYTNGL